MNSRLNESPPTNGGLVTMRSKSGRVVLALRFVEFDPRQTYVLRVHRVASAWDKYYLENV